MFRTLNVGLNLMVRIQLEYDAVRLWVDFSSIHLAGMGEVLERIREEKSPHSFCQYPSADYGWSGTEAAVSVFGMKQSGR